MRRNDKKYRKKNYRNRGKYRNKMYKIGASRSNYPRMSMWTPSKLVNFGGATMPDSYMTKLNFLEEQKYNLDGGSLATVTYRHNSPYDPEFILGGFTAVGYPELAGMYNNYRVAGSSCRVIAASVGDSTTNSTFEIALLPSATQQGALTGLDPVIIGQQRYGKYKVSSTWNAHPTILKQYASTAKLFGVPKIAIDTDDAFASDVNNNPFNQSYWQVTIRNWEQSAGTMSVKIAVRITYYVTFFRRKLDSAAGLT